VMLLSVAPMSVSPFSCRGSRVRDSRVLFLVFMSTRVIKKDVSFRSRLSDPPDGGNPLKTL
jgi:hypothetical protein